MEQVRLTLVEVERLRREAEAAQRRSAFLSDVSMAFSFARDCKAVLDVVPQLAVPRLADWCVADFDGTKSGMLSHRAFAHGDASKVDAVRELWSRYSEDPQALRAVASVVRSGTPELFEEISEAFFIGRGNDSAHVRVARQLTPKSAMVVPLIFRGQALGTITLVSSRAERNFTQGDLELASDLAARTMLAINNAMFHEAAQRALRVREDLLAIVSHDLRNPLGVIVMRATHLQRVVHDGVMDESVSKSADAILKAAKRMTRLIADLLDAASLEAGGRLSIARQPRPVAELLTAAIDSMRPLAEARGQKLSITCTADGVQALCDAERIQQIFSNLIGNAIKFTPDGGAIAVRGWVVGSEIRFAVTDTGPGIAEDHQERLFDRYWQVGHESRNGVGLGLYIARALVEAHGGRIWVESRLHHGSTFFFTLPL